jgi:integrase
MKFLRLRPGEYDKLLDKDVKLIQLDICDWVTSFKMDHSSASVSTYLAAIMKFYSMNDIVTLNWKKIKSYQGEHVKVAEDRPYNHNEIQALLSHATFRNKAIILLMSSTGLRLGAVPSLRIRDLEPIEKYGIYKIKAYSKSVKSSYFTFCTPECRHAIDLYLDYRRRWAERITADSPLFRLDYNFHKTTDVRSITNMGIRDSTNLLLIRSGLRKPHTEGKVKRTDVMANHGFRKFFETNAFKAGMDPMYIRRLMGQRSGLEDSYLKLSEEELLEGDSKHVGFVDIIDQLTIDDSQRLKRRVETLEVEKNSWEALRVEVENLKALLKHS